jgi:hypothetical protein
LKFLFLYRFSTQFPNTISKASTLRSEKILSQENSKFVNCILHVVKNAIFFTSNAVSLQST